MISHGWVKLAPWHWDSEKKELSRLELSASGNTALVKVSQLDSRSLTVQTPGETLGKTDTVDTARAVQRWFSLNWDPRPAIQTAEKIDPLVALFIKQGGGRFLRSTTFYEDFVKTICTINTNWSSTVRMVASLVDQLGTGTFPSPVTVLDCGEQRLRKDIRLGFRARVLAELSSQLLDLSWIDNQGNLLHTNITFDGLREMRGIGEYSASHLMMLAHQFERIPIDSEVTAFCRQRYRVEPNDIQTFFAEWGTFRFLGYKLQRILNSRYWDA